MESLKLNEIFLDENYSLESLLAKTQETNLSLNDLRKLLIQHQQDLNQTSLDLFNNSYDKFYKLSFISCLAEPIQNLIDPLQNFQSQLSDLCQKHDAYLKQIDQKVAALEETSKNKELAKILIELIRRRDRIEAQMGNIDWTVSAVNRDASRASANEQQTDSIEYTIKCDLLERVNVELYYLTRELSAIQPTHDELIPIKKSLEMNLKERQSRLDSWFESSFLDAIEKRDNRLTDLIIRTYQQKNSITKLDLVWRDKVVRPYLNLTLTDEQLPKQLSSTYELLDQFIRRQLELITASFVVSSFWNEVVRSLDKLQSIYSLCEIETFQKRYIGTREFLRKQNNFIQRDDVNFTQQEVDENCKVILKKFNLEGYFNYRATQIESFVEQSLSRQPLSETQTATPSESATSQSSSNPKFKLNICINIYNLVEKCWSPELYIDSLELNFSQLACRIINRFASWLSKLRLSDFRITGPAAPEISRQTNFLAKQDAIMRLLIDDCGLLVRTINEFLSKLDYTDKSLAEARSELFAASFRELDNGLSNVRSLQMLIER